MARLNQAAIALLDEELRRRTQVRVLVASGSQTSTEAETAGVIYELLSQRLDRLHRASGQPISYSELRRTIVDLLPDFSDPVLRRSARLNRPKPKFWGTLQQRWIAAGALATFGIGAAGVEAMQQPQYQQSVQQWLKQVEQASNTIKVPQMIVAEVEMPRSSELIPTAQTFAQIVEQSMRAPTLSVTEWRTVVNQWQEAIELLQQVPRRDRDYKTAQTLITQYQKQQYQAKKRLKSETAASDALKIAKTRWKLISKQRSFLKPREITTLRQQSITQLDRIKPEHHVFTEAQQLRNQIHSSNSPAKFVPQTR
jgi:hypothetical protein